MVNLYVYRATDPKELKVCQDPIGQENSLYIREESSEAVLQSNGGGYKRDREVMNLIKGRETNCLSTKKAWSYKTSTLCEGSGANSLSVLI
ncbi:DUF1643 domain-containing protein [Alkalicoccobacillus plakortidis]|uniref:DUF1643 domain-containing protein n=1 Tax=Alkalicoccobacillus plakortidis TaxID=444060 RepID=UPI00358DB9E1